MTNAFCSLIGIDVPIVQAAMGGATSPQLAAAVSNAGGLGMLAHGWSTPDAIRAVGTHATASVVPLRSVPIFARQGP